jgi:hypothetical protein
MPKLPDHIDLALGAPVALTFPRTIHGVATWEIVLVDDRAGILTLGGNREQAERFHRQALAEFARRLEERLRG